VPHSGHGDKPWESRHLGEEGRNGTFDGVTPTAETITGVAISRLGDRLRSLPASRLSRVDDRLAGQSIAAASHAFAQWCAWAAAGIGQRQADTGPEVPGLPRLDDLASGDQVQLLGRELIVVLATVEPSTQVWLAGSRVSAERVSDELRERVDGLRSIA